MKKAFVEIKGASPISFSKLVDEEEFPKLSGESHDDYDKRVWMEKAHFDGDDVVMLGQAFKFALDSTAQRLSIKRKGSSTWTQTFKGGVLCPWDMPIGAKKSDMQMVKVYCHANGSRSDSKRVHRRFPIVHEWGGIIECWITDDEITLDVFRRHADACGKINGIGRFRPQNSGKYGRFSVENIDWQDER
jgi:hypothetical protein